MHILSNVLYDAQAMGNLENVQGVVFNIEAIKEIRIMGLGKYLRVLHEARLKEIRDRHAREDYACREGWDAGHSEGCDAGRSEGENRPNRLYSSLIADQRFEDIERSVKDKEYRDQLYKEYGIF